MILFTISAVIFGAPGFSDTRKAPSSHQPRSDHRLDHHPAAPVRNIQLHARLEPGRITNLLGDHESAGFVDRAFHGNRLP
jgi:hypothetical protein